MQILKAVISFALISPAAFAQPVPVEEAAAALADLAEAARAERAAMSYEEFLASVPFIAGIGKWIVNGDVAIRNEKLLREFYEQNVAAAPPVQGGATPEFTILNRGGLDQIWNDEIKRSLTYCISTDFGARHAAVAATMAGATAAWEAAADVDFVYVPSEDAACTSSNQNVLFDVGPMSEAGSLLAVAFFPNEPRADRTIRINDASFELPPGDKLTLEGVLRHELGHVLGARHEHTRPDAGRCFEDADWRGVTDYDAFSVMHYPQCNGMGDWSLTLTAADRSGVACIYGPAAGFVIDTAVCQPRTGLRAFGPFTLAAGGSQALDPIPVAPGGRFRVRMTGDGGMPGDPDLYLKFEAPALLTDFDCRPFEEGADETCDVTVPPGSSVASVMVHAATDAAFRLEVLGGVN